MTWLGNHDFPSYLRSGAANWVGEWVRCGPGQLLIFQVSWTADAGTAFTLGVDGTNDPARATDNIITLPALTSGIYGAWPTVGATAGTALAVLRAPFQSMRVRGDGSGGVADQFSIFTSLRAGG